MAKIITIPKQEFIDKYKQGLSRYELSKLFGISRATVKRRIEQFGLPKRNIDEQNSLKWHPVRIESLKRDNSGKFVKSEVYPLDYEYTDKGPLIRRAKDIRGDKCENCGWNEDTVDGHHIVSITKGGKNILTNIVLACPNCHRLIHSGKLVWEPNT